MGQSLGKQPLWCTDCRAGAWFDVSGRYLTLYIKGLKMIHNLWLSTSIPGNHSYGDNQGHEKKFAYIYHSINKKLEII